MNWKLIFTLSLFGVAMAIASLFGVTHGIEPFLWLIIFIVYAIVIAKKVGGKYFLHGFLVSFFNGVWIAIIHATFFSTYIANNPEMVENAQKFPQFISLQAMMLVIGPVIGALTGVIAGVFALVAARVMKKKSDIPSTP